MNIGFFVGFTAAGYYQRASALHPAARPGMEHRRAQQFSVSLLLMGLGCVVLPVGISLAGADGKSVFVWRSC